MKKRNEKLILVLAILLGIAFGIFIEAEIILPLKSGNEIERVEISLDRLNMLHEHLNDPDLPCCLDVLHIETKPGQVLDVVDFDEAHPIVDTIKNPRIIVELGESVARPSRVEATQCCCK